MVSAPLSPRVEQGLHCLALERDITFFTTYYNSALHKKGFWSSIDSYLFLLYIDLLKDPTWYAYCILLGDDVSSPEGESMKRKSVASILSLGFLFLIAGGLVSCDLRFPSRATGRLSISFESPQTSRTILPRVEVNSYIIHFEGPTTQESVSSQGGTATVDLMAGSWNIQVDGLDAGGLVIAEGRVDDVSVVAGGSETISIALSTLTTGSGSADISLTWPEGLFPSVDGCKIFKDGNECSADYLEIDLVARRLRYREELDSGSYGIRIALARAGTEITVYEALHIYGNLCSQALIELEIEDFNQPPAAPSGLMLSEGLGSILLSWTDNSRVENGFSVERSANGLTWTTIADDILPNAGSYTDSSAAIGTEYSYRLKAFNALGHSQASNIASASWAAPTPGGTLSFSNIGTAQISVSWIMANDNNEPSSALEFRLYYSNLNNIGTQALAQANGIAVMDWTAQSLSQTISGLASGVNYHFMLLVRDSAGNIGQYEQATQATLIAQGSVNIAITVLSPIDEPLSFNEDGDPIIDQEGILQISVNETFDSYQWVLDSGLIPGAIGGTLSLNCSPLSLGVHHLAIYARKNGLLYSSRFRFSVGN